MRELSVATGLRILGGIAVCLVQSISASAMSSKVPVVLSVCTAGSAGELAQFVDDVNVELSVAHLSAVISCSDQSIILGGGGMISLFLAVDDGKLYLRVQPVAQSTDGDNSETWQREIQWTSSPEGFIEATRAKHKLKTFALLIDNMVLDYAGIRISPAASVSPSDDARDGLPFPEDEDVDDLPAMMPGVNGAADGNDEVRTEKIDLHAERSVVKEDDEICEQRLEHLKMTMDKGALNPENCAKRFGIGGAECHGLRIFTGVAIGADWFSRGNIAPQLTMTFSLRRRTIGLVIRGTMEGDSNFRIGPRPFDTRSASMGLGAGMFFEWKRLMFALQSLVVFRYWEVVRSDVRDATTALFVDMGTGLFPLVSVNLTPFLGIFVSGGAAVFPRARQVVVENGPHKRIGRFHFPLNVGLFFYF
jgi:hypothetical protein